MFVCLKHNFAFLAIPKTGTTSIEKALEADADIFMSRPPNVKHMKAPTFEKFIRPYLHHIGADSVQTVAVMRDPIRQLESWYSYRRRTTGAKMKNSSNSTQNINFEEFIEGYLSDDPPKYAQIGTQSVFLGCEDGGDPIVDYIFANEQMDDLIRFLEHRMRKPLKIERRNASPQGPTALPKALHARLVDALAADIALHRRVLAKEFQSPVTRVKGGVSAKTSK